MASEEHKDLANFIKNVHKELRLEAQRCEAGPEVAWEKHLERTERLQAYAGAMKRRIASMRAVPASRQWMEADRAALHHKSNK